MSQQETGDIAQPPSESSPLLRDNTLIEDGVVPCVDAVAPEGTNGSDIPLAQEPTVRELLLIMSSVWVGVIFAALGKNFNFLALRACSYSVLQQGYREQNK